MIIYINGCSNMFLISYFFIIQILWVLMGLFSLNESFMSLCRSDCVFLWQPLNTSALLQSWLMGQRVSHWPEMEGVHRCHRQKQTAQSSVFLSTVMSISSQKKKNRCCKCKWHIMGDRPLPTHVWTRGKKQARVSNCIMSWNRYKKNT